MIIIDNYISNPKILAEISKDYFTESGFRKTYWWDGWWNSKPNSLPKILIKEICNTSLFNNYKNKVIGFEYWNNILTEGKGKEMHLDTDESLTIQDNLLSIPLLSIIFYYDPNPVEGGFLEVFSQGINNPPERILPKYNRLVIFDGGNIYHQVSRVTKGVRYSFTINLWDKEPKGLKTGSISIL